MAGNVVIHVEELGKKYIIGHETERERYTALREVAVRTAGNFWKRVVDAARGRAIMRGEATEEIWALKDVSFEVKRGEVLGIIGRNGAGKSTLLKILSRITEPSEGRVTITGRVASLLEVGTGFHSELTGRENIYLNGAILGMSRAEIGRKFDEIVDFSGVEKFIDTPVKRYSSGMQVRLAFSVAAHLEPEILVVDEVLAVGDAEFQKKCLGKMGEVSTREGRTVLFVSHQLSAVTELTNRAILLDSGIWKNRNRRANHQDHFGLSRQRCQGACLRKRRGRKFDQAISSPRRSYDLKSRGYPAIR
jgi:lipopolysaccharide transport system ATP-binding protein